MMKNFKIVWEIELTAENPLDAAKTAQEWIRDERNYWQFWVQDEETEEIFTVDLEEPDENAVLDVETFTPLIRSKK